MVPEVEWDIFFLVVFLQVAKLSKELEDAKKEVASLSAAVTAVAPPSSATVTPHLATSF